MTIVALQGLMAAGGTLLAPRRLGWRIPPVLLSALLLLLVWLRRLRRPLSAGTASARLNASMTRLDAELRRAMDPRWFQGAGERITCRSPPVALQSMIARYLVRSTYLQPSFP